MNSGPNILLVTKEPGACLAFLNHLEHAGSRTVLASDAEDAARLLLAGTSVDAILIHHESIAAASLISSAMKIICPFMPIILVTTEWPGNAVFPDGVDAICYASSLGRRLAGDIMRFVRYLVAAELSQRIDNPRYDGARFVPQKPGYLN